MDKKTTSWVSYLTWIGWLIAYLSGDKEGAKFHLNQSLAINIGWILGWVVCFIPFIGFIIGGLWNIFCLICAILGIVSALNDEDKEVPLFGQIKLLK